MEGNNKETFAETTTTTTTSAENYEPSGLRFNTRVVSVQIQRSYAHYKGKVALVTGLLQILLGLFTIALGISQPIISTTFGKSGIGIWCGVIFCIAGIMGIISKKKQQPEVIVTHMVFNVLASVAAGLLFAVAVAAAVYDNLSHLSGTPGYYRTTVAGGNTVAVDCLLAIAAFFAAVVSIVAAAISCQVTCCNNNFLASQKEVDNPNVLSYHVHETKKYTVNPSTY